MQQPDKFICISYSQIDFLIPNDYVVSAVGVKDVQVNFMHDNNSGIFDFDDIATGFKQYPRPSHVKTLIILKDENNAQFSIVTTQECKVCTVPLKNFRLISDYYAEGLKKFGLLACNFVDDKVRFLIDVKQAIQYMNRNTLEEVDGSLEELDDELEEIGDIPEEPGEELEEL